MTDTIHSGKKAGPSKAAETPTDATEFIHSQLKTRSGRALLESIVRSVVDGGVVSGKIDPRGKKPKQLAIEVRDFLLRLKNSKIPLTASTDYRSTLLREARIQLAKGEHEFAFTLYATWLEHWANHLIISFGRRKKLPEKELRSIVRESPFRAKFTWVLSLLGLPRIAENHLRCISSIADYRNSFVHYKWDSDLDEPTRTRDARLSTLAAQTEKTIRYLAQFENKHLYHGYKRKIQSIVSFERTANGG